MQEAAEGTEKKSKTEAEADKDKEKEQEKEKEKGKKDKDFVETKSIFHGGQLRDYLGRSFVDHPTHLKAGQDHECFMPKKIIHTWYVRVHRMRVGRDASMSEMQDRVICASVSEWCVHIAPGLLLLSSLLMILRLLL